MFYWVTLWFLCLNSTTAGTAARSSATPALTTSCRSPPHPNQSESVTHAMRSCFSGALPLPPKPGGGRRGGLPHYVQHIPALGPQASRCLKSSKKTPVAGNWQHLELQSKMADHWFQVLVEDVYILQCCAWAKILLWDYMTFLAAGQSQTFLARDRPFQTWSMNTSLLSMQHIIPVKIIIINALSL